jgi:hypothetical protein
MTEHYCEEHKTKFFKTANMKTYAHPIKDDNGNTAGWHNEPKAQPNTSGVAVDSVPPVISQPTPPSTPPVPSTPVTVKSNTTRDRDNDPLLTRRMCLSYAKDMIIPLYRDDIRIVPVRDIELTAERLVMWVYGEVKFDEAELLAPFIKKD